MLEEGGVVVNQGGDQEVVDLPPGFRFHPTDAEIIIHYLKEKVFNVRFTSAAIGQADLNKNEPWDLPSKSSHYLNKLFLSLLFDLFRNYNTSRF